MKKIITLLILLTFYKGNTQCPAPSNLVYSIVNTQDLQLSWTENGTASTWDITVVPDFYVGAPLPTDSYYTSSTNPFIFANFPPTGCNVFFVRSRCSATDVSPWIAFATSGCDANVYSYLATLSNQNFNSESKGLQIFPNPSKNVIQLKINTKIDKITVFDSLGKVIIIKTQNNNEIDVENISKGVYIIEVFTENEKIYKRFIKE